MYFSLLLLFVACEMSEDILTSRIIGEAIEVHIALGPGLLENTYKECLYYKLGKQGFSVEKEKAMPIILKR